MQHRTRTTLFLDSTGLLERSTFLILEKIARVANDTRSRSFREYRLLDRLRLAMANHVAMEACHTTDGPPTIGPPRLSVATMDGPPGPCTAATLGPGGTIYGT